jgi:hypothetical protein
VNASQEAATAKPKTPRTAPKPAPKAAPKSVTHLWAFGKETPNMVQFERMWGDRKITHYVPKDEWEALGSPSAVSIVLTASE